MDFNLLLPYVYLAAGLIALILCGNWLVTGGVQLARHLKISTLIIGLTIVASGTSAPELFVSVGAALKGAEDIALGNVIGSNIANIALIIGFIAIILPIPVKNKSTLFDLLVMLVFTVLLFFMGLNGILGRIEGICLVTIYIAYIIWSFFKEKKKSGESADSSVEKTENPTMKLLPAVLLIAAAITGLYFGSEWFINGARDIALQWGVSERVIGISIVAVGTSMPELVTSVTAAVRKEMDLSVGNIIGSNIFNIAIVLGTTSIIKPLNITSRAMFTTDMIWVFGIAVLLLLAMLPFSKGSISRWKGGVFFVLYAVYIFILYRM